MIVSKVTGSVCISETERGTLYHVRQLSRISEEAIATAIDENSRHDGPCNEAIRQAKEFYAKLKAHVDEATRKRAEKQQALTDELENPDAEGEMDAKRALPGFPLLF